MRLEITHYINEECREIYGFNFDPETSECHRVSTFTAYLNPDGAWGDEWETFYAEQKKKDKEDIYRQYLEETGEEYDEDESGYGCNRFSKKHNKTWFQLLLDVSKKYTPVRNKHPRSGKPYYGGSVGLYGMEPPKMCIMDIIGALKQKFEEMGCRITYKASQPFPY